MDGCPSNNQAPSNCSRLVYNCQTAPDKGKHTCEQMYMQMYMNKYAWQRYSKQIYVGILLHALLQ